MIADDFDCVLSEETLNILNQFLNEEKEGNRTNILEEDWQLSQFWYDEKTSRYLADQCLKCIGEKGKIACISCPTLFIELHKLIKEKSGIELVLFEFDKRFNIYGSDFKFYDYNEPLSVKEMFRKGHFDLVIADPPFLSEECLSNVSQTIDYLSNSKIIVCTGAVMENIIDKYLFLRVCTHFIPQHKRKLGNEFRCYTNFPFEKGLIDS